MNSQEGDMAKTILQKVNNYVEEAEQETAKIRTQITENEKAKFSL